MHLAFVDKQFYKVFFKPTVSIPIDAANIVAEHVLAVIGKFHGRTVVVRLMIAAEITLHVVAHVQIGGFQAIQKFVVDYFCHK